MKKTLSHFFTSSAIQSIMKFLLILFSISILIINYSCKKEPVDQPEDIYKPISRALYVLNQGSYSSNNASVTRFDLENEAVVPDYFNAQNGRALGDVANDLLIYGSKAYIITNVSSQLEVVDATTLKSIKQIPFFVDGVSSQPSAITSFMGKVYVCSYDGFVTVIDTATLEKVKEIEAGLNPDAIHAAYGKIWVSNSGGLNYPDYDSTVSVIDPVTMEEETKFVVGTNPYTIQSDTYGDIYVITRGNYGDIKMRLKVFDATTLQLKKTFEEFEAFNFTIRNDTAFVYYQDFMGGGGSQLMLINVKTEEVITNSFVTDNTVIKTLYGIAADPTSGDIYVCDANNFEWPGKVYCFNPGGKVKYSFNAGVNPVAVRFLIK